MEAVLPLLTAESISCPGEVREVMTHGNFKSHNLQCMDMGYKNVPFWNSLFVGFQEDQESKQQILNFSQTACASSVTGDWNDSLWKASLCWTPTPQPHMKHVSVWINIILLSMHSITSCIYAMYITV